MLFFTKILVIHKVIHSLILKISHKYAKYLSYPQVSTMTNAVDKQKLSTASLKTVDK